MNLRPTLVSFVPLALEIEISVVFAQTTEILFANSRHNLFVCVQHKQKLNIVKEPDFTCCRSATQLTQRVDTGQWIIYSAGGPSAREQI